VVTKPGAREGGRPEVFDDREKAFEAKYRHDEEIAFKVDARCAQLFGRWAAVRLGLAGAAVEAYAQATREADLSRPNHVGLLQKVLADLLAHGIAIDETELRAERERLLEDAKKQILQELGTGRQHLEPGL